MSKLFAPAVAVVAALSIAAIVALPVNAGDVASYNVSLNGSTEVPGPGDPIATGDALLLLGTVSNEVCVDELVINDLESPATAMHIHSGAAGVAGPIVVDLSPGLDGQYCTTVTAELMAELITDPGCYYLNIHNGDFPAGAIRGQLTDQVCSTTPTTAPPATDTTAAPTTSTAAAAADTATRPSFTG
jgi:hypothetical protein